MAITIKEIEETLRNGVQLSPHEAVEYKLILAGEYSFAAGQLETILSHKPLTWLEIRKHKSSDAQADREYERSEDGVNEIGLKLRLKSISTMMSSLTSLIKVAEGESKSQW